MTGELHHVYQTELNHQKLPQQILRATCTQPKHKALMIQHILYTIGMV